MHDNALVSPSDIGIEANVRVMGKTSYKNKRPSLYLVLCGLLLGKSFLKYAWSPMKWMVVGKLLFGFYPVECGSGKGLTMLRCHLCIFAVAGSLALRDFCEAGTIVFLFSIVEWLQTLASHRANAVMSSLMSSAPQKATFAATGELVNVEDVRLGTVLAVKTGEIIPIDGLVVEGSYEVDEKAFTREAFIFSKEKDSNVLAGTINLSGNSFSPKHRIAHSTDWFLITIFHFSVYISLMTTTLSEEAQNKKPRFQRLIDECAKYYTPVVVLLSVGLAVVPAAMRVHNLNEWLHLALSVIVSACPCGLILSTPAATFRALSEAAINRLLIKGGDYLESLSKIKTAAFDKTGTITRGEF
ncbi:hypothetical protein V2J09_017932 [Rumex salicifolius]